MTERNKKVTDMHDNHPLVQGFEANRTHLRQVAYRMLGSASEAEDAVQEAWIRLHRTDPSGIDNLGGWLTTVVARVCLDMLRSRRARREQAIGPQVVNEAGAQVASADPEQEVLLADSVGLALLVVLETLTPAERVAFVLHDMFDLPFDDIAPIVGRSSAAARKLASRARLRVQGARTAAGSAGSADSDLAQRRKVVDAFLAASRSGDFEALLALLDPDVVLRADSAAVKMGVSEQVRGATEVAATFAGRARAAQPALVDGAPGLVWAPGGQPRVVFGFTISGERIVAIEMISNPERVSQLQIMPG